MRIKSVIILLFAVIMVMLASTPRPPQHSVEREQSVPGNSIQKKNVIPDTIKLEGPATPGTTIMADSIVTDSIVVDSADTSSLSSEIDTLSMDSLHLAIYRHNKAVDDSLRQDSLNRMKPNGIDSPVTFSASDSIVYDASTKNAFLYGSSKVDYEEMNLTSEHVHMNLDQSIVSAIGVPDSTERKGQRGTPVFKMGKDQYESDSMMYNFKSKKGFITNAYTEQEDGFLFSQHSKRDADGNLYLEHGTYTTCDV